VGGGEQGEGVIVFAVIGAGHDVIENAGGFVVADLQYIDDAFVFARDGLETPDAFQFALVWAGVLEAVAMDELHRAELAERGLRQLNFPITAAIDAPQQSVLGYGDRRGGHRVIIKFDSY
jgi:hypothetical protein